MIDLTISRLNSTVVQGQSSRSQDKNVTFSAIDVHYEVMYFVDTSYTLRRDIF